uniref:X-prolyl aminopeptidase (aminopeptidase P) 2, membrane-bound n=1 Tax=Scleropages formosus TaxID=113540 RepID=A0A8C9VKX9_SCLFO
MGRYLPPTVVNSTRQLQGLRLEMSALKIHAYIIPGTDAHLSEYIAPRDARRAWMTGFTGSAGTAVVTQTRAVLWTDSRYWVQAERQMDCNWELERDSSVMSIAQWLIQEVPPGQQIGFDPFLFSIDTFRAFHDHLAPANRVLKSIADNLVDKLWEGRPEIPPDNLTSWQQKVDEIRERMMENPYEPTAVLLSALDETAWLFNLRGNDIPYNPFFYSYTLLTLDNIWLFVHNRRVPEELREYLNASSPCQGPHCVQLPGYESVRQHLQSYVAQPDVRVWIGTEYTTQALFEIIAPEKLLTSDYSPVLIAKAVKDETERHVLRRAHVRDAVAVIQLLYWLEKNVPGGQETELTAARFVENCRRSGTGSSFETISASGPNAALAHYSPTDETCRKLRVEEMYLIDSGGQYLDGTTDITRTLHWGTPTDFQKEAYTRVLMGNIEISRTVFPAGTRGINIEMLGRRALWEVGLNYGHGTGHGVGNYFGVHECKAALRVAGLALKPGYYKENDFGIRIEDVAVVVPAKTKHGHGYLTFDTVSLVPYDRKLIDTSLLSPEQLRWLDSYYLKIRTTLGPVLKEQNLSEEFDWLMTNTEPFLSAAADASPGPSPSALVVMTGVLLLVF